MTEPTGAQPTNRRRAMRNLAEHEGLNFILTNRIPRRLAGLWVGWISRSENLVIRTVALWTWRQFAELDLSDAEHTDFQSMHDCFTRRLRPGARAIDPDPDVLVSPCDAIIGACGRVTAGQALQVKGMDYPLADLLDDPAHAAALEGGTYVTLRLTSSMYHRFHAPQDCRATAVRHVSGDRWNVNPPALRRVRHLFCRNERVVIQATADGRGIPVTLVAVAAILVSGIRLGFLTLGATDGRAIGRTHRCDARFKRGQEVGWFEHGSTIILLTPAAAGLADGATEGERIRMGAALLRLPAQGGAGQDGDDTAAGRPG